MVTKVDHSGVLIGSEISNLAHNENLMVVEEFRRINPTSKEIEVILTEYAGKDPNKVKIVMVKLGDGSFELRLRDKDAMEKYIEDNTKVKVGDITKAKFIFFGETHYVPAHATLQRVTMAYLQSFHPLSGGLQECLLREGKPFGVTITDHPSFDVDGRIDSSTPGMFVTGWEDRAVHLEGCKLAKKKYLPVTGQVSSEQLPFYVQKYSSLSTEFVRLGFGGSEQCTMLKAEMDDLLTKIHSLVKERSDRIALGNEFHANKIARDRVMLASVKKSAETYARIFCIAGSDHLEIGENFRETERTYNVNTHFPENESALIIPKDRPEDLTAAKKKYIEMLSRPLPSS